MIPASDTPTLPEGLAVSVHYHLRRKTHKWVITPRGPVGSHPRRNRVAEYAETVVLRNARAVVSEKQRQWVIDHSGDKPMRQVHAWIYGDLSHETLDTSEWIRVTYNPFRSPDFHIADTGEPVRNAPIMAFRNGSAWIPPKEQTR